MSRYTAHSLIAWGSVVAFALSCDSAILCGLWHVGKALW